LLYFIKVVKFSLVGSFFFSLMRVSFAACSWFWYCSCRLVLPDMLIVFLFFFRDYKMNALWLWCGCFNHAAGCQCWPVLFVSRCLPMSFLVLCFLVFALLLLLLLPDWFSFLLAFSCLDSSAALSSRGSCVATVVWIHVNDTLLSLGNQLEL